MVYNSYLDDIKQEISNDVDNKINLHYAHDKIFYEACITGQLETVKYLLTLEEHYGKFDIHTLDDFAFNVSCRRGHLEIVKYLISIDIKYLINMKNGNHTAYLYSCEDRQLDVVKYLCSLYEGYIKDEYIIPIILSDIQMADIKREECKQIKLEEDFNSIYGKDIIDVVL